jgi:hypothetical protein
MERSDFTNPKISGLAPDNRCDLAIQSRNRIGFEADQSFFHASGLFVAPDMHACKQRISLQP